MSWGAATAESTTKFVVSQLQLDDSASLFFVLSCIDLLQVPHYHGHHKEHPLRLWGALPPDRHDVDTRPRCSVDACSHRRPNVHGLGNRPVQANVYWQVDPGSFPEAVSGLPPPCTVVEHYRYVHAANKQASWRWVFLQFTELVLIGSWCRQEECPDWSVYWK